MRKTAKVATWLEMVVAPHTHDQHVKLRVHPIRECKENRGQAGDQCYAISIDGRWLYSNDGSLTVLQGIDAVDRFMRLVRMPSFEHGEPAALKIDCGRNAHCIAIGPDQSLHGCVMSHPDAR